jgi:hypothetical protein
MSTANAPRQEGFRIRGNILEVNATSPDHERNILREISHYSPKSLDIGNILDVSKDAATTFSGNENNVLRKLPDYSGARITKVRERKKRGLKGKMMEAIKEAKETPDKWKPIRVEEQHIGNVIKTTEHSNNYATQTRRIIERLFVRTNTGISEIGVNPYETELAIAEACEEKLDGFRKNHYTTLIETVTSLVKEYEQECHKHGDAITPEQEANLRNQYQEKLQKAREKYEKAIADLDEKYKNSKLDSQLLADLQQMQAKEANDWDIERRRKSVESKIARQPEKLNENTKSIQSKLDELDRLVRAIGPAMDTPGQSTEQGTTNEQPQGTGRDAIDQRSSAEIIAHLRSRLSRGSVSFVDYARDLKELTKRCPLNEHGNELYKTITETMRLFSDREIITHEWEIHLFKRERFIRSHDAETMGYSNQLLQLYDQMKGIQQELTKAEELHSYLTRETNRIFNEVKTSRDKDSRPATGATLFPAQSEQERKRMYQEIAQKAEELRQLQQSRQATGASLLPADIAEGIRSIQPRHASRQSTDGQINLSAAEIGPAGTAEKSGRYKQAQELLDRTFLNLLSVRAEAARLNQIEKSLQKQIELADSRYQTNELREGRARDRIVEADKERVAKKRQVYEQIFAHQMRVAETKLRVLLIEFTAREARKFALVAMMLNLPNALQREVSSQANGIQNFLNSL